VSSLLRAAAWDVTHGFTTRAGGVSVGPYLGLNLGLSSGDDGATVERNRDLLLGDLGYSRAQVVAFHQVHGDRVLSGDPGWFVDEADAAVTDRADVLLVVSTADCVPLLFHDPRQGRRWSRALRLARDGGRTRWQSGDRHGRALPEPPERRSRGARSMHEGLLLSGRP